MFVFLKITLLHFPQKLFLPIFIYLKINLSSIFFKFNKVIGNLGEYIKHRINHKIIKDKKDLFKKVNSVTLRMVYSRGGQPK